jgi:hypothetical protein
LWQAVTSLVLAGAAIFVLSAFRGTVLQAGARDEMRGRLQGATTVVAVGGPWLAEVVHGTVGAAVGTMWAISGGGILVVLAMISIVRACPAFWPYRPLSESASPRENDDPAPFVAGLKNHFDVAD